MKKLMSFVVVFMCLICLNGCGQNSTETVNEIVTGDMDKSLYYENNFKEFRIELISRLNNHSIDELKVGKEISIEELKKDYPKAYEVFNKNVTLEMESYIDKCLIADIDNDGIEDVQICYTDTGIGISSRSVYNDILFSDGENYRIVEENNMVGSGIPIYMIQNQDEMGNLIGTWGATVYCLRYNGVNYQLIYDANDYSTVSLYYNTQMLESLKISQEVKSLGCQVEYKKDDTFSEIVNKNISIISESDFIQNEKWLVKDGSAEELKEDGWWGSWYTTKEILCDVNNDGVKEEYKKYIPAVGDSLAQISPNWIEDEIFCKYDIERDSYWVEKDKKNENVLCVFNVHADKFTLTGYKIKNEKCEKVFSVIENIEREYKIEEVSKINILTNDDLTRYNEKKKVFLEQLKNINTYEESDKLINDIYGYLRENMEKDEFEKLKSDEIRWVKDKEKIKKSDLFNQSVETDITRERCEYLLSLFSSMKYLSNLEYNKEINSCLNVVNMGVYHYAKYGNLFVLPGYIDLWGICSYKARLVDSKDLTEYRFFNYEKEVSGFEKYTLATTAKYDLFPREYEYCEVDLDAEKAINDALCELISEEYKSAIKEELRMKEEGVETIIKSDFDGDGKSEKLFIYNAEYLLDEEKAVSLGWCDASEPDKMLTCMAFILDSDDKREYIYEVCEPNWVDCTWGLAFYGVYDLDNDGRYEIILNNGRLYGGISVYHLNNGKWEEYLCTETVNC